MNKFERRCERIITDGLLPNANAIRVFGEVGFGVEKSDLQNPDTDYQDNN